jgi:hypothetical protein
MSWTIAMNEVGVASSIHDTAFRLTEQERRVIEACSDVLLPPGGAIRQSGRQAGVVERFEQIVGGVSAKPRLLLRALLALVEMSGPATGVFRGRFTKLDSADQRRVLHALMNHRVYLLRTAFLGLRTMLTLAYFSDDEVNRELGCQADLDPFHLDGGAA